MAKKKSEAKNQGEEFHAMKNHLIDMYRAEIADRYDYKKLKKSGMPPSLGSKNVEALREYFLRHLYPASAERDKL